MALKYGRTSRNTSSILPDGKIRYSQAEYDANVAAIASEASRKKDYDAGMAKFKSDSDAYYGKSAIDKKKAAAGAAMINQTKTSKGENIVATAAGEETQAQMDKRFDDAIKSGKKVMYNDPSIDDETRRFLKGATFGQDLSRTAFDKGLKITNYNQIYEGDYNPEIWEADAKKGEFGRYGSGSHAPDKIGMYTRGITPVSPGEYVPKNVKPIDLKNSVVDWKDDGVRLKPLEVKFGGGELRMPKKEKEKEELTWQAPMPVKKKGLNIGYTKIKPGGKTGIKGAAHPFDKNPVRKQMIKYNTEKRQSAAYFSGNTALGESITGKTESELRQLKKDTRGEAGTMLKAGRLGSAATIGKDLGTIRKAIRYVKKGDISIGSVGEETGVTKEGQGSKLRYFTPEFTQAVQEDGKYTRGEGAMYGYQKYQAQEKDKAYRAQNENATNRNITWGRQQGASEGTAAPTSSFSSSVVTRGQMKDKFATDNPTASKKEIRQGVQKLVATNKQTLKDLREAEIKKGMY
jgi:hypothetical protein